MGSIHEVGLEDLGVAVAANATVRTKVEAQMIPRRVIAVVPPPFREASWLAAVAVAVGPRDPDELHLLLAVKEAPEVVVRALPPANLLLDGLAVPFAGLDGEALGGFLGDFVDVTSGRLLVGLELFRGLLFSVSPDSPGCLPLFA